MKSRCAHVARSLTACAKQDNLPIGKTPEYDYAQYVHQIPGGMISNLRHQLRRVGMENKLDQTLEEAAQVRAEFGYPIMVTPLSQFVGSQAAINVIVGERYKQVTDQTIEYAMGIWGKEGAELMDPNVKEKILNRPRAKEIAERPHPTDSLQDLRRKYGGPGVSDEEVLLRFFTSKEDVERMRAAGPARDLHELSQSVFNLVETLSKKTDRQQCLYPEPRIFRCACNGAVSDSDHRRCLLAMRQLKTAKPETWELDPTAWTI